MAQDTTADARDAGTERVPAAAHGLLLLLMIANVSSLLDRSIMSMLVEPITATFGISYVEFGLLHGLAFAVLYSLLGIPIGRAVDQFNRVRILSCGIFVWSLMTALCGMAWNFTTLFLARVGVGVGEAALNPAAYSLLADSYPRRYLARAIGTFMISGSLGFGLSFAIGGLLVSAFADTPTVVMPVLGAIASWKIIFIIVAVPGLAMALVMYAVPEPSRKGGLTDGAKRAEGIGFGALGAFLRANRGPLACHFIAYMGITILLNGLLLWAPTFLRQTYGLPIGKAGLTFGILFIVFGAIGAPAGGWLSDRLTGQGKLGAPLTVSSLLAVVAVGPAILFPWVPNLFLCCVLLGLVTVCVTAQTGLAITALQLITPNALRGQLSAVFLLCVNMAGLGIGPVLLPALSRQLLATDRIGPALSIVAGTVFVVAFVFLRAGLGMFRLREADQIGR